MKIVYKGADVYYRYKKGGRPILFLHGWGGNHNSFKPFIREEDLVIDFPPFGRSGQPLSVYTLQDYVNIVLNILQKEKIQKISIVAHSFGGRVALELAAKYKVVDRLLLTGCAGLKPKFSIKKYINVKKYKRIKKKAQKGFISLDVLDKYGSSDYQKLDPIMKKTFVNIVKYYQNDILKSITCATLLVWGKQDKETPLYMAKTLKQNIKDCELIVYSGGHFAYIDNCYAFNKLINNFLRKEL